MSRQSIRVRRRRAHHFILGSWLICVTALASAGACSALHAQAPVPSRVDSIARALNARALITLPAATRQPQPRRWRTIASTARRLATIYLTGTVPVVTAPTPVATPLFVPDGASDNPVEPAPPPRPRPPSLASTTLTSANVTVEVDTLNANARVLRSACLAFPVGSEGVSQCADLALAHSLPAITVRGTRWAPQLLYNSQHAHPYPLVNAQVTVTPPSGLSISAIKLRLLVDAAPRDSQTWTGTTAAALFPSGSPIRATLGYDPGSGGSVYGLHPYTVQVITTWSNSTVDTSQASENLAIIDRRDTPFGAGWWLSGYERLGLYTPGGPTDYRELVTHDDGSTTEYVYNGSQYISSDARWADTLKYVSGISRYVRSLRNGGVVQYDGQGRHRETIDRLGNTVTYFYTGTAAAIDSMEVPGSGVFVFYYDANGIVDSVASRIRGVSGSRTLRIGTYASSGGTGWKQIFSYTDPDGATTSYGYANTTDHRIRDMLDPRSVWSRFTLDGAGKLTAATIDSTYSNALVSQRISPAEVLLYWTGAIGAPRAPSDVQTKVVSVTNSGDTTRVWLDRQGAPVKVQDALGNVSITNRDAYSRPLLTISPTADSTTYTWTAAELLKTRNSSTARTDSMTYESTYHELTTHRVNGTLVQTNVWGSGLLLRSHYGSTSAPADSFYYDVDNNLYRSVDPSGHATLYTYSTAGNLASVNGPLAPSSSASRTTTLLYDAYGRVIRTTLPNGTRDTVGYDLADRVRYHKDPLGHVDSTQYDGGYVKRVFDGKGEHHTWLRNAAGWVVRDTEPAGGVLSAAYDAAGNVVSTANRRGQTVTFSYDALGRVTQRVAGADTAHFAYSTSNDWNAAWNAISRDTIFNDRRGRMTAWSTLLAGGGGSYTGSTGWNDRFGVRASTSVVGASVRVLSSWTFDDQGRLTGIGSTSTGSTPPMSTVTSNNEGALTALTYPSASSLVMSVQPMSAHRPSGISFSNGTIALALDTYARLDSLGRVIERRRGNEDTVRTFSYDDDGRLAQVKNLVKHRGTNCHFDPDLGRVCTDTSSMTRDSSLFTYDADDAFASDTLGSTTVATGNRVRAMNGWKFEYDADGNLTRKFQGDSASPTWQRTFSWNALNQLTTVLTNGGSQVDYRYDALGRLVIKRAGGSITRLASQAPAVDWGDFVPGFATAKAIEQTAQACRED